MLLADLKHISIYAHRKSRTDFVAWVSFRVICWQSKFSKRRPGTLTNEAANIEHGKTYTNSEK